MASDEENFRDYYQGFDGWIVDIVQKDYMNRGPLWIKEWIEDLNNMIHKYPNLNDETLKTIVDTLATLYSHAIKKGY